jgi:hypothetical protein
MLSLCLNSKQVFNSNAFVANVELFCANTLSIAMPLKATLNVASIKTTLLGRSYFGHCRCCNHRKLKRRAASCGTVNAFELVCDELTKDSARRCMDKICDPGEDALAFQCARITNGGAMIQLEWRTPQRPVPAASARLRVLATEMHNSTCGGCLLVLSFKAIMLLMTLDSCPCHLRNASRSVSSSVANDNAITAVYRSDVIKFVLKQVQWSALLDSVKQLKLKP